MSCKKLNPEGTWFVMVNSIDDIDSLVKRLYVPLNSNLFAIENLDKSNTEIVFKIYEVYQVGSNMSPRKQLWGIWNPQYGLKTTNINKWVRRADLTGLNLKMATLKVMNKKIRLIKE